MSGSSTFSTSKKVTVCINDVEEHVELEPYESLNHLLREKLGLTGTKRGCDYGGCGACTVIVDNKTVYSCMTPAMKIVGKKVLTVEYLSRTGKLHIIQESFVEQDGLQCGYCTPGFIMSTYALLSRNKNPTDDQVRDALSGNVCRCTGYQNIFKSIRAASAKMAR